jgi:dephospho-CoA kinase
MRIGLTGGIGCGVSLVAERFSARGIPVVKADDVGRGFLQQAEIKRELLNAFGRDILSPDGEIDRNRLGMLVFSDPENRAILNRIMHPPMIEAIAAETRELEARNGVAAVDAALIYEWGIAGFFHKIIVVQAPLEQRLKRISMRDSLSREEVEQRIAAQMPIEEKCRRADFVIVNDGTRDELARRVDELIPVMLKSADSTE